MNDRNLFHAATAEDILVPEDKERLERLEYELACALENALSELGYVWTTSIIEETTGRKLR